MSTISLSVATFSTAEMTTNGKCGHQKTSSQFDALLASVSCKTDEKGVDAKELVGSLIDNIMRSLDEMLSSALHKKASNDNAFPLSGDFESVFGNSGPLIDFINETTSRLGLSAKQNQALQDIAVKYKDITPGSPDVQAMANDLKQAGIIS